MSCKHSLMILCLRDALRHRIMFRPLYIISTLLLFHNLSPNSLSLPADKAGSYSNNTCASFIITS